MKYWTTQDGEDIAYKDLKDSHLLNILKWIERRAESGVMNGVCFYNGDDDFMTGDIWEMFGEEVLEYYDYKGLKKEAKKRNINN